jgi:heme/copper-type cytochrome/quinol oxidase subunit 4
MTLNMQTHANFSHHRFYCVRYFNQFICCAIIDWVFTAIALSAPLLALGAIWMVNQFCFIQAVIQIVFYLSRRPNNRVAYQIHVFNAGVFYTIILSFLALAALDRYLAVARYEWYTRTKQQIEQPFPFSLRVYRDVHGGNESVLNRV